MARNVVMLGCLCDAAEQCRVSGRPRLKLLNQLYWSRFATDDVDNGFERFDLVILCSLLCQLRRTKKSCISTIDSEAAAGVCLLR